jgi:hypothetical protein
MGDESPAPFKPQAKAHRPFLPLLRSPGAERNLEKF